VSLEEKRGYIFWGPVAFVIAFFEIGAATAKWWKEGEPDWPTISATVGHLETVYHVSGVFVVGVIAMAGFYALTWGATAPTAAGAADAESAKTGEVNWREFLGVGTYGILAVWILTSLTFVALTVFVTVGPPETTVFRVGYALYGSLLVWGIIVPLFLQRFARGTVRFPNLFQTIKFLREHFRTLAVIVVAGLSVLVIHLALYPWPDVPHESTGYAGLSSSEARRMAEDKIAELKKDNELFYTSQLRGHAGYPDVEDVWLVYFNAGQFPLEVDASGCVVAVREDAKAIASPKCST
jgi:hypothetical protein